MKVSELMEYGDSADEGMRMRGETCNGKDANMALKLLECSWWICAGQWKMDMFSISTYH